MDALRSSLHFVVTGVKLVGSLILRTGMMTIIEERINEGAWKSFEKDVKVTVLK